MSETPKPRTFARSFLMSLLYSLLLGSPFFVAAFFIAGFGGGDISEHLPLPALLENFIAYNLISSVFTLAELGMLGIGTAIMVAALAVGLLFLEHLPSHFSYRIRLFVASLVAGGGASAWSGLVVFGLPYLFWSLPVNIFFFGAAIYLGRETRL